MMNATLEQIQGFVNTRKFIMAGVSRNTKKFGYQTYQNLLDKGYDIIPVNPNADEINGTKCYRTISDVPSGITHLLIMTSKDQTDALVREAAKKGITHIWVQQTSNTKDTEKIAAELNINLVQNKCIHMFTDPVNSVHKFHKSILKLFGILPK
jgi:uncharacterized protein